MSNVAELTSLITSDNPVILNVGANNGAETNMFLERFPNCHVYSFEPEPRCIAAFRRTVDSPRATLIEKAVGAENKMVTFYQSSGVQPGYTPEQMPEGWDQSGSVREPFRHIDTTPWVKFESTIDVEMTTLDRWAETSGVSHVDLIWADVQGAEEDMIRGAQEVLSFTRFLYTEYCNIELYKGQLNLEQLCGLLKGFELVKDYNGDALFKNINL